jgi:alkyldihydroxyacetonephosphate synthase
LLSEAGAEDLGPATAEAWFKNRYDFSRLEAFLDKPGGFAETIEVAFAWREAHGSYLTLKEALRPYADEVVGHFSHAYSDGISCYLITTGELGTDQAALDRLEQIWSVAMETALGCGAVISHHHGVGTARLPYLPRQLGTAYDLLVTLKHAIDPGQLCHPGSLVDLAGQAGPRRTP